MPKLDSVSINIRHWARNRDPMMERIILECIPWPQEAAQKAYHYAQRVLKRRWSKAESKILVSPRIAYLYAKNILKERWKEAEPVIATDEHSSYYYSKFVLKGKRFNAFEANFSNIKKFGTWFGSEHMYLYALHISKERLPKNVERKISESGTVAAKYARTVLKGRWKAAEKNIVNRATYSCIDLYIRGLKDVKHRRDFRTLILAKAMSSSDSAVSNRYWCAATQWLEMNERSKDPVTFN